VCASPDIDDLKTMSVAETTEFATRIRDFLIRTVTRTGGHLGSNLGVVELTLALHRVFDSPKDRIVWDTGHQSYAHKIVTGRIDGFGELRMRGGLSGYPNRAESEHDIMENSHASTALSYADGLAKADAVLGDHDRNIVAVIGDGTLTGGMAWEAINNLIAGQRKVIVVLNDNGRSYSPTVGGMAAMLGPAAPDCARGFDYIGPVDGHDLVAMEDALNRAKAAAGPVFVHAHTIKGKGYLPAEQDEIDKHHVVRAAAPANAAGGTAWTAVFERELAEIARQRPEVVGVTAAMLHPVGLATLAHTQPDRVFDVGLAEQHAVTCSAGMAMAGLHPVVPIYSTFANRAFDQVLLDGGLHRCGITLVLDRAGITGDDGPSHNGTWDLSLMQIVPGLRIAAPRDADTLCGELREALDINDAPTVLRFPKGEAPQRIQATHTIDGVDILHGEPDPRYPSDVLIVSVGAMASACVAAAATLHDQHVDVTVVDPRWVVPVSPAIAEIAQAHRLVVTVEDNIRVGGVGTAVTQALADSGVHVPVVNLGVDHRYLPHASRGALLAEMGLTGDGIADRTMRHLCSLIGEMPAPRTANSLAARYV
jgi:1-deoxy-D-xylulose-5-phosphate synthase